MGRRLDRFKAWLSRRKKARTNSGETLANNQRKEIKEKENKNVTNGKAKGTEKLGNIERSINDDAQMKNKIGLDCWKNVLDMLSRNERFIQNEEINVMLGKLKSKLASGRFSLEEMTRRTRLAMTYVRINEQQTKRLLEDCVKSGLMNEYEQNYVINKMWNNDLKWYNFALVLKMKIHIKIDDQIGEETKPKKRWEDQLFVTRYPFNGYVSKEEQKKVFTALEKSGIEIIMDETVKQIEETPDLVLDLHKIKTPSMTRTERNTLDSKYGGMVPDDQWTLDENKLNSAVSVESEKIKMENKDENKVCEDIIMKPETDQMVNWQSLLKMLAENKLIQENGDIINMVSTLLAILNESQTECYKAIKMEHAFREMKINKDFASAVLEEFVELGMLTGDEQEYILKRSWPEYLKLFLLTSIVHGVVMKRKMRELCSN